MPLKGDVKSLSLANVLQDLAMNEQSGTLRIQQKNQRLNLWFDRGGLRLVGFGRGDGPSIINGLLALGKITTDDLPADGARKSESNLVRRLEKKKTVSRGDLRAALEHQMTEHVCDAFLWHEATFEFHEGDPADEDFDVDHIDYECRLVCDGLIMEALRRADEWKEATKIVISSEEILVVTDPSRIESPDAITKRVLSLLDGEKRLRDVMDLTRLGRFSVHRVAAQLLRTGAARTLKPAEALERAQRHAKSKRWVEALALALYGLEHERNNGPLRILAAQCYEEMGDTDQAVAQFRLLAANQTETKNLEGALETFRRIVSLAPRDTYAHERIFQIQCDLGRKAEALEAGDALAGAYKRAGLPEKAREMYAKLVGLVGEEDALLESIAEIARHLGDKKEATQLYRKLLARALDQKNAAAALDHCRTILKLDPSNEEIAQVKADLESGVHEARSRRKRRLILLSMLSVLLVGFGAAGYYEYRARTRFSEIRKRVLDAAADRRYDEALRRYDEVIAAYPYSLIVRELKADRAGIEEKHVVEELKRAEETADRNLSATIDGLALALKLVHRPDLRKQLEDRIAEYKKRRAGEEERYHGEVAAILAAHRKKEKDALKKLEALRSPHAIPALSACLGDPDAEIRAAAVDALAGIEHPLALDRLVRAVDDVDPKIRQRAADRLAARTGQNFGLKREDWEQHLRVNQPIRAWIRPRKDSIAVGEPVVLEWKILNGSSADIELQIPADLAAQLEARPVALRFRANGEGKRRVFLRPGEYLGGTFTTEPVGEAGTYTIAWTLPVAGTDPVAATPVTVQVK